MSIKYSIDDVRKYLKKHDIDNQCTLLSTEYIRNDSPLELKCNICGEKFQRTFKSIMNSKYYCCVKCNYIKRLENKELKTNNKIQTLPRYLRRNLISWTNACLKNSNYTCDITGKQSSTLEVHHLVSFTNLIEDTLKELNLPFKFNYLEYTTEELLQITKLFQKKHTIDIGVVIQPEYHTLFHQIYGKKDNTKEQYNKFKYVIQNGLI